MAAHLLRSALGQTALPSELERVVFFYFRPLATYLQAGPGPGGDSGMPNGWNNYLK